MGGKREREKERERLDLRYNLMIECMFSMNKAQVQSSAPKSKNNERSVQKLPTNVSTRGISIVCVSVMVLRMDAMSRVRERAKKEASVIDWIW